MIGHSGKHLFFAVWEWGAGNLGPGALLQSLLQ